MSREYKIGLAIGLTAAVILCIAFIIDARSAEQGHNQQPGSPGGGSSNTNSAAYNKGFQNGADAAKSPGGRYAGASFWCNSQVTEYEDNLDNPDDQTFKNDWIRGCMDGYNKNLPSNPPTSFWNGNMGGN